MFVHCHLLVALTVEGVEIVSVAGAIDIAVDASATDADVCAARCVVLLEISLGVLAYVDISGDVVAAVYATVNEDVRVCVVRRIRPDADVRAVDDVAHEASAEDVLTVDGIDAYVRLADGVVEPASEDTAAE